MIELKLGKITSKELSAWFNISDSSFRKAENKKKYLEILTKYADFHLVTKGNGNTVYIDAIYEPIYTGEAGPSPRQRIKELVQQNWNEHGLDTCSRVASQNYPILKQEGYTIAESTNYRYTCDGRTELWGSPMKRTSGSLGSCRYEYAKIAVNGAIVPLNAEEQKIKDQLIKKYFGNLNEWTLGVVEDLKKGRITEEEAGQALKNLDAHGEYLSWKGELEAAIGNPIVKATRVEESAF